MNYIRYEQDGFVGIITIDRPKTLNALNLEVLNEFKQTMKAVDPEKIRCVVITGSGNKSFVAGADLGEMCNSSKMQATAFSELGNRVLRGIELSPIPAIAAINGYALGGGTELAAACDIRIASDNAIFGMPETSLGIMAGFGGTQRLPRIVGLAKAKELLYTAQRIDAQEALKIGLVNAVYPQEQLMEKTMEMAHRIAKNAPIGLHATKQAINRGMQVDMVSAMFIESQLFGTCFETKDQVGAMTAYLEKRKPEPFING